MNEKQLIAILEKVKEIQKLISEDSVHLGEVEDKRFELEVAVKSALKDFLWSEFLRQHPELA